MSNPIDWCTQLGLFWLGIAAHPDELIRILKG